MLLRIYIIFLCFYFIFFDSVSVSYVGLQHRTYWIFLRTYIMFLCFCFILFDLISVSYAGLRHRTYLMLHRTYLIFLCFCFILFDFVSVSHVKAFSDGSTEPYKSEISKSIKDPIESTIQNGTATDNTATRHCNRQHCNTALQQTTQSTCQ